MRPPAEVLRRRLAEGMARTGGGGKEWRRAARWCSYKRATLAVCCVNLVAALYVLRLLSGSFRFFSPPRNSNPFTDFKYTESQIKMAEESVRLRRGAVPVELIKSMERIREELDGRERRWQLTLPLRQMLTNEIIERLRGVKNATNVTEQREAIEVWRIEKLKAVKMGIPFNSTLYSSISAQEGKVLENALDSSWHNISEEIGLWMPADVINNEISDKPENAQELEEDEIIPGRPLPPECRAELHTDYDGTAVRWGLTHHKDSAADCCQACLDQAKHAKPGEMKCNIWVYCPSEYGCYSPDIYQHRHQECWLKQALNPRLNFKDKYSEQYRSSHPNAPVAVPWMSGIIRT